MPARLGEAKKEILKRREGEEGEGEIKGEREK